MEKKQLGNLIGFIALALMAISRIILLMLDSSEDPYVVLFTDIPLLLYVIGAGIFIGLYLKGKNIKSEK